MSDTPLSLPARPSLEQLRKQAKDRLASMPDAKLADAQFALARDYGFDSWPKLVRHVDGLQSPSIAQHDRIAHDMVAAYRHSDEAAAARLNDLFHSALSVEQIQHFIRNRVWRVFCGDGVTDSGLAQLHEIPRFRRWQGERRYSLLEFEAGPTYLAAKGAFTARGLRAVAELEGLFALNLHWTTSGMTSADLGVLRDAPNLGFLAIDGNLTNDEAMRQIGALPRLNMLLAQEPVAGDEGFAGLSRSKTLEYFWARECPNLTGRGFAAMAEMPALKGLAASCRFVDDNALALLPRFPALRALMPMDVTDDGFRHVGRCERLEELWCMYCRETGDKATEQIADLKLKSYYAGHTQITDHSLDVLSRMTTLARIDLYGRHGITDAGVHRLTALPHLRHLSMEGCRNLTRAAAAGFGSQVRVNYSAI
jgi:hypothetical protein